MQEGRQGPPAGGLGVSPTLPSLSLPTEGGRKKDHVFLAEPIVTHFICNTC
ncbi:hypothetical protein KDAU_49480 [Dictyobacter aurantiacus]|uniref:Uncharacterized protein n=1 Tax=Dictyobacter aurantiacus TaxID=1936993 RepID=A0A401ZL77_9CHLR|nr:hypothetical protein KDAU_49480 [Dictyobacter aurantiacus]